MDTLDPVKGLGVCIVIPGGYVFAVQDLVVIRAESVLLSPIVRYVTPKARYPNSSIEVDFKDLCRSRKRISCSSCLSKYPSSTIPVPRSAHLVLARSALVLPFPACRPGIGRAFLSQHGEEGLPHSLESVGMVDQRFDAHCAAVC